MLNHAVSNVVSLDCWRPLPRPIPANDIQTTSIPSTAERGHNVIHIPTTASHPNRFAFADVVELLSWARAIEGPSDFTVETEADPRRGQRDRIGTLRDGCEFVTLSTPKRPRGIRIERRHGLWVIRHVWSNSRIRGWAFPTVRRALEHLYSTIGRDLRPALPDDPPDGYPHDDGEPWYGR